MAKPNQQQLILDKGLIAAAAASSILKVRAALDFGANANYQDPEQYGWSALHFCCYFSLNERPAERICKTLLSRNAQLNAQAHDGTSPLLAASAVGSLVAVELLLYSGAQVDLADNTGKTPLMGAADRGDVEIARALLAAGANAEIKDQRGATAGEIAQARGHHSVAAVIEAALIKSELALSPKRPKM